MELKDCIIGELLELAKDLRVSLVAEGVRSRSSGADFSPTTRTSRRATSSLDLPPRRSYLNPLKHKQKKPLDRHRVPG